MRSRSRRKRTAWNKGTLIGPKPSEKGPLCEALGRLVVFDAPGLDEGVEGRERILLALGHPDLL
jgi:hypothetical protein